MIISPSIKKTCCQWEIDQILLQFGQQSKYLKLYLFKDRIMLSKNYREQLKARRMSFSMSKVFFLRGLYGEVIMRLMKLIYLVRKNLDVIVRGFVLRVRVEFCQNKILRILMNYLEYFIVKLFGFVPSVEGVIAANVNNNTRRILIINVLRLFLRILNLQDNIMLNVRGVLVVQLKQTAVIKYVALLNSQIIAFAAQYSLFLPGL